MEIVTNLGVLMRKAVEFNEAKQSGDPERIKKAQKQHDGYRDICLSSDCVELGVTRKDLSLQ